MKRVAGAGVTLAVRDEGDGSPVLLLHGFPDSSHVWRHQIPALVDAGKRAIAADLRGYGESDKPEGVAEYGIGRSVGDMLALLDGLGVDRADLVGHDYGAALAWALAAFAPGRVNRLAVLSVAHPNAYRPLSLEQREKWWYQLFFQFEGVAEELLARDDWQFLREFARGAGDQERWVAHLSRPGALTAALNWYRANGDPRDELGPRREFPSVAAPTLALWSTGDRYLLEEPVIRSEQFVTGPWRYERIEGVSHWLQIEAPDRVNQLLLEHLA